MLTPEISLPDPQFAGAAVIPSVQKFKEEIYFFFSEFNKSARVDEEPYRARIGRICMVTRSPATMLLLPSGNSWVSERPADPTACQRHFNFFLKSSKIIEEVDFFFLDFFFTNPWPLTTELLSTPLCLPGGRGRHQEPARWLLDHIHEGPSYVRRRRHTAAVQQLEAGGGTDSQGPPGWCPLRTLFQCLVSNSAERQRKRWLLWQDVTSGGESALRVVWTAVCLKNKQKNNFKINNAHTHTHVGTRTRAHAGKSTLMVTICFCRIFWADGFAADSLWVTLYLQVKYWSHLIGILWRPGKAAWN